jgi:murein L,D-transpeptidase YcbB/YkuD
MLSTCHRLSITLLWFLVSFHAVTQAQVAMEPYSEAIRSRVDRLRYGEDVEIRGTRVILTEQVAEFYEGQQFRAFWSRQAMLDELIAQIDGVLDDGLNPDDYHAAALRTFRRDFTKSPALGPAEQAELELIATDAMLLALYHLHSGKVDPVRISSQWNFLSRPIHSEDARALILRVLSTGQISEAFEAARPEHVWYRQGRERLATYRKIAADGGWPRLPDGPVLKAGMDDPRVPVLRRRLRVTGDLDNASAHPAGDVYDEETVAGVKRFQERHGLTVDGVVGPATRDAMNVTVAARIDQIRINLERARWVFHELHGDFVLVDVAGFAVSYFRNDEPVWRSRAVVGRPYRETPIFKSEITYVVFNPTWTIPPGIIAKDKLPVIKRDPGYLDRNNIKVIDRNGRRVDPYSVNWKQYRAANIPYQLVQDPGPQNALGLVKIMFPNPYLVYLHDSPAKSLFDRDERAFSSGCIRVQKAFELAELVLNDPAHWNQESMSRVVASKRTQTVHLREPVSVLILYWTAEPRANGQVSFRNDIYHRDAATLAALDSDFRLPSRQSQNAEN